MASGLQGMVIMTIAYRRWSAPARKLKPRRWASPAERRARFDEDLDDYVIGSVLKEASAPMA